MFKKILSFGGNRPNKEQANPPKSKEIISKKELIDSIIPNYDKELINATHQIKDSVENNSSCALLYYKDGYSVALVNPLRDLGYRVSIESRYLYIYLEDIYKEIYDLNSEEE